MVPVIGEPKRETCGDRDNGGARNDVKSFVRTRLPTNNKSGRVQDKSDMSKILYHVTTQKKAKLYRQSGAIRSPVRGFTTMQAAMAWAMKVGRVVILEFEADSPHKLSDHHNRFGEAWWNDGNVTEWRCVFSADSDA